MAHMPGKLQIINGQKSGFIEVLETFVTITPFGRAVTVCKYQCACGKIAVTEKARVVAGKIKSCGCMKAEFLRQINVRHGHSPAHSSTSEYRAWRSMKDRCANPKNKAFHRYGGRGIKVCKRWRKFENFFADMGKKPSIVHSLDRIKNNKGYNPVNCAWRTPREQQNNKRSNKLISFEGLKLTLAQFARRLKLPKHVVYMRYKNGWSIAEIAATPLLDKKNQKPRVQIKPNRCHQ